MGRPSDARVRLIEAAREVIFTRSYKGVTVDDLCAAAGVHKSSFYHYFPSKQALTLAAIEQQWRSFEETVLAPIFSAPIAPEERMLRFFDDVLAFELGQVRSNGHMRGCPAGNLTLEMSTQDEPIRTRVNHFFGEWLRYFEGMLREAQEQGSVPPTLDTALTAQALLAYFEGVMLLAKGRNDPTLIATLRMGVLPLMQYQGERQRSLQ